MIEAVSEPTEQCSEAFASVVEYSLGAKYSYATTDLFGYADSDGSGYLDLSANFTVGKGVTIGAHAGKQNRELPLPQAGEELVERGAGELGVDAAEGVVGAEFDDHRPRLGRHRPVDPGEAVAGSVA